jgi:hypothetical protein
MGHIAKQGVVGTFIEPSPAGLEHVGYKRNVALGVLSTAYKGLPARISKRNSIYSQRIFDDFSCSIQVSLHHIQSEVLQFVTQGPCKIAGAGM